MAGDAHLGELIAFLARLTGEDVTADQPMRLRSVQRAALSSWARKHNLPIRLDLASTGAACSVRALLAGGPDARETPVAGPIVIPDASPVGPAAPSDFAGVGIDIEETAALPTADDYRAHPFYQDNFTAAEIAYCIRQADARASFCGTWAAKEAVLKSGLAKAPAGRLDAIEIARDGRGRPVIPGGHLSISHTATTAVAVCIAMSGAGRPLTTMGAAAAPLEAKPVVANLERADPGAASPPRQSGRRVPVGMAVAAGFALLVVGSAISLAMHLWH